MVKNNGEPKICDLPTDYCAFMVAIVLVRLVINKEDIGVQFKAEEIAKIVNALPHSRSANFFVNPVALKHGMNLFKREISKRGINTIEVYKEERGVTKFFNLESNRRSIELKFASFRHTTGGATQIEIIHDIAKCRDEILKAYKFEKSIHQSASSVYGDLHMPSLTKSPKTRQKLRIKSPSKLCKRTIQNSAEKLIQIATEEYGEQYAEFYLNRAVKKIETKKRKAYLIAQNTPEEKTPENAELNGENGEINPDEEINRNEERNPNEEIDQNDENDRHQCADIEDDERILDAIDQLPQKNVTYNEEDKSNILIIFKMILDIAVERDFQNPKIIAARTAEIMLARRPYYSQITSRTILRWHERKDKVNEKTGPKINAEFERQVWGKLMQCCFEQVILYFNTINC
jgi:MinD-like ATPase involved in chromosome partitioning or flagellar assembly